MRHWGIAVLLYTAITLELRDVHPLGFACWWLDFVLLMAVRRTRGIATLIWCSCLGLLSDVMGASPPGIGLLCGSTAGLLLSSLQSPALVSPLAVAFGLMCWHSLTHTLPVAESWLDLPLTRSLPTFLIAVTMELIGHLTEQRRQAALLLASRN